MAAVALDAGVQHLAAIALPPVGAREDLDLRVTLETGVFDPAAQLWQVDHAVTHHAAVFQQVGGRRQPVADVQGQQPFAAGTCDLCLQLGVPPDVIGIDGHAQRAAAAGVEHGETLTGFKWIARVSGLVYGYEEALGYCVAPTLVRDKDGITTALLVAELAADLRARGKTLLDELDALAVRFGVHATDQLSVRIDDLALIGQAMARLRTEPPQQLAGQAVISVEDLAEGAGGLPPTDGLRYRTNGGIRVVVRPSGTEPKLKCYLEAVVPVSSGVVGLPNSRSLAARRLAQLRADLNRALALDG